MKEYKRTFKNSIFPLSVKIPKEIEDEVWEELLDSDCGLMGEEYVAESYERFTGRNLMTDSMISAALLSIIAVPIILGLLWIVSMFIKC